MKPGTKFKRHPKVFAHETSIRDGDAVIIYIPNVDGGVCQLIVDVDDYEKLVAGDFMLKVRKKLCHIYNKKYEYDWMAEVFHFGGKAKPISRWIMRPGGGKVVDHINGNVLDNRKVNLRNCSIRQNCMNRTRVARNNKSGVNGVGIRTAPKKRGGGTEYFCYINIDKRQYHYGFFRTIDEAAAFRRELELKYYKEFAPIIQTRKDKEIA